MAQQNITTTQDQPVTVEHVDPCSLLVDKNVRTDARLDPDFIASLKEHGVLTPIVAVRTSDAQIRVRLGHRRTLGAIEAGLATVPVIVAADEATTKAGEIQRLVQQYAENEHRTGLSTIERTDMVAQLSAFGVSAAQIVKRTRMPRQQVDAALTASKSSVAREGMQDYNLTIDQAAVVAEFQDDLETASALIAAAQGRNFEHAAQRARDDRAERVEYDAAAAPFREAGLTVISRPTYGSPVSHLDRLTDDITTRDPLTAEGHSNCPGHAAYLDEDWIKPATDNNHADEEGTDDEDEQDSDDINASALYDDDDEDGYVRVWNVVHVCTEPERHAPRYGGRSASPSEPVSEEETEAQQAALKEQARQERREVIENNRAWRSAETVRREWVTAFLTRKTAPKGTGAFLAAALTHDAAMLSGHDHRGTAFALLGLDAPTWGKDTLSPVLTTASEGRAQVIALGLVLGAYERDNDVNSWRNVRASIGRYLRFLASLGYPLSEVERRACGEDPLPSAPASAEADAA